MNSGQSHGLYWASEWAITEQPSALIIYNWTFHRSCGSGKWVPDTKSSDFACQSKGSLAFLNVEQDLEYFMCASTQRHKCTHFKALYNWVDLTPQQCSLGMFLMQGHVLLLLQDQVERILSASSAFYCNITQNWVCPGKLAWPAVPQERMWRVMSETGRKRGKEYKGKLERKDRCSKTISSTREARKQRNVKASF